MKYIRVALYELRQFFIKLIKNNGISALVSLAIILAVWRQNAASTSLFDWLDFSVLSSVVFALIITGISLSVEKILVNHIEDSAKLTQDYSTLCTRYVDNLFTYENSIQKGVEPDNLKILLKEEGLSAKDWNVDSYNTRFPITLDAITYGEPIQISDSDHTYELPAEVQDNYDELIRAHNGSTSYNQLVIRVDNWYTKAGTFYLKTSRSTYFNSLVTNRAMDYEWDNGLSNRKLYDYGPFVTPLSESKLSNHMGFNGFVESSDGYIPLMLRGKNVTVGKKTYSTSVSGSLKAKYALNNHFEFTLEGFEEAIINEIYDEIKINKADLLWSNLNNHVITFFRDMVEGGKPHFMFYVESSKTKNEIDLTFHQHQKKKKKNGTRLRHRFDLVDKLMEDGDDLLWIPKEDLKSLAIGPSYFVYKGKKYNSIPSYVSNLAMMIEFLDSNEELR